VALENDTHAALREAQVELVTLIEHSVTGDGTYQFFTVAWTVIELVGEAMPASGTFFHVFF
jgi:hypothetical protein